MKKNFNKYIIKNFYKTDTKNKLIDVNISTKYTTFYKIFLYVYDLQSTKLLKELAKPLSEEQRQKER